MLAASVIDENLAHQPRRHREEVRAVLQRQRSRPTSRKYTSWTERRGLQRVRSFAAEPRAGHAAQFAMNDRNQSLERSPELPPRHSMSRFVTFGSAESGHPTRKVISQIG